MEAIFFLTRAERALGITSSHDLDCEPVAESLRLDDPSPLLALPKALGVEARVHPVRDATCRSFPVWGLGAQVTRRVAGLDDAQLEDAAARWHADCQASIDADPWELSECIGELRAAARGGEPGETLFVLLTERAF